MDWSDESSRDARSSAHRPVECAVLKAVEPGSRDHAIRQFSFEGHRGTGGTVGVTRLHAVDLAELGNGCSGNVLRIRKIQGGMRAVADHIKGIDAAVLVHH